MQSTSLSALDRNKLTQGSKTNQGLWRCLLWKTSRDHCYAYRRLGTAPSTTMTKHASECNLPLLNGDELLTLCTLLPTIYFQSRCPMFAMLDFILRTLACAARSGICRFAIATRLLLCETSNNSVSLTPGKFDRTYGSEKKHTLGIHLLFV